MGTAKVTKLKAGIYTVVVQDKASDHNFHLKGPGVNKATSVSGKISTVWKVTLKEARIPTSATRIAHTMKGSFIVS